LRRAGNSIGAGTRIGRPGNGASMAAKTHLGRTPIGNFPGGKGGVDPPAERVEPL
jgi:hypothetical protein